MQLVFSFVFALLSLLLLTIQKTYYHVPRYELKRRARGEDKQAKVLYRAVAYESSLHVVLWTLIGLSSAASFVLLSQVLAPIVALLVVAVLTWWYFVWLPGGQVSQLSLKLTELVTPAVAWLTAKLHPFIERARQFLPEQQLNQSDIFETEDLLAVLEHQKGQADSRINLNELDAAQRVLSFGHKLVRDVVLPRAKLKLISEDDPIGPVLLTELHDSGLENFIVYKGKQNSVVGTLNLHTARTARGGRVADAMQSKLVYVNEAQTMADVLQAFRTTKAHTFMVVNQFDEFVGIVTIEQVLQEALGDLPATDFEAYESRAAVAGFQPVLEPVVVDEEPEVEEPIPQDSEQAEQSSESEEETPSDSIEQP